MIIVACLLPMIGDISSSSFIQRCPNLRCFTGADLQIFSLLFQGCRQMIAKFGKKWGLFFIGLFTKPSFLSLETLWSGGDNSGNHLRKQKNKQPCGRPLDRPGFAAEPFSNTKKFNTHHGSRSQNIRHGTKQKTHGGPIFRVCSFLPSEPYKVR